MSNMVVNTNVLALNSHRSMKVVGNTQSRSASRLSSGLKINSAADDAAGLSISEKMRAQIRGLDMASKNSQDAISLVQTAEGGMQEIDNMVQRIRELVVQSSNDTNENNGIGTGDRQKLQDEVNQLISEIDSMANRVEFNKKKLINGDYAGSKDRIRVLEIAYDATSKALTKADANVDAKGSIYSAATLSFNNYANDANWTDYSATGASAYAASNSAYNNKYNALTAAMLSLATALGSNTGTISVATSITAAVGAITSQITTHTDSSYASNGVAVTDASLAAVCYTGSYVFDNSTLTIPLSGVNTDAVSASTTLTNGASVNVSVGSYNETIGIGTASVTVSNAASLSYATTTSASNANSNPFNTVSTTTASNGSDYAYKLAMDNRKDPTKAADANAYIKAYDEAKAALLARDEVVNVMNDRAAVYNNLNDIAKSATDQLAIAKQDQINANTEYVNIKTKLDAERAAAEGIDQKREGLYMQVGANAEQGIFVTIGSIKADSLGLVDSRGKVAIDLLKNGGGDITGYLEKLDTALSYVTTERSKLGATQNRLEYTIKSLDISSENLTASESRIRDTDMAKEMMNLTKTNVLQQAAMSMLAQANQNPQNILQLLR